MKIVISVENELMEQVDSKACDLGLSRSGLVAQALREYLAKRRGEQITEQLNRVYAEQPITADERLVMRKMTTKVTRLRKGDARLHVESVVNVSHVFTLVLQERTRWAGRSVIRAWSPLESPAG